MNITIPISWIKKNETKSYSTCELHYIPVYALHTIV